MCTLIVNQPGAYIRRRAGNIIVEFKKELLQEAPIEVLQHVMVFGNGQLTSQAMATLLERGIPTILFSQGGKYRGILTPGFAGNCTRRIQQYAVQQDQDFRQRLAAAIVQAKITSQLRAIRRWKRNRWIDSDCTLNPAPDLDGAADTSTLFGVEANTSAAYFSVFAKAVPPPFYWTRRSRRPPRDPVNAMLSLAYMMALSDVIVAVYKAGLDPQMGFLHHLNYNRPNLALDLLEPLRAPFCDHFALKLMHAETFDPSDFTTSEVNGCRFGKDAINTWFRRFETLRTKGMGTASSVSLTRTCYQLCRAALLAMESQNVATISDFFDHVQDDSDVS